MRHFESMPRTETIDDEVPPPSRLSSDVEAKDRDLGFGGVLTGEAIERLLNRDGSFNVRREGESIATSLSPYHWLVTMSWPRFLLLIAASLLLTNAIFGAIYLLLGEGALNAGTGTGVTQPYLIAFFFSVQTFATIGYGQIAPVGVPANLVVTIESYYSILYVALATGLVFARFSRPTARLLFSENAVIAPYRAGHNALMFRFINLRRSQMIELTARVLLVRWQSKGQKRARAFDVLQLERNSVTFFPAAWTIVHPIDDQSPLWGATKDQILSGDIEILVLISGIDETFAQTVHARTSYGSREIRWGAKFADIYVRNSDGSEIAVDLSKLSDTKGVELAS